MATKISRKRAWIEVDKERCKGCGLCIEACPVKIITFSGKLNHKGWEYVEVKEMEKCIGCSSCAIVCPDVAIEVFVELEEE